MKEGKKMDCFSCADKWENYTIILGWICSFTLLPPDKHTFLNPLSIRQQNLYTLRQIVSTTSPEKHQSTM